MTINAVDKSSAGIGERQYHIGVAPGEVSTVALLPGDPFRVPMIAEFLSDVQTIAHQREHLTMTGRYKGRLITATSTGMGCPSAAIAAEELIRVGVTSLIRVGSSAALQAGIKPGDLLVSEGSLRNDGTTAAYALPGYPAVPDFAITSELTKVARELTAGSETDVHAGFSVSDDAFYAETPEWIAQLHDLGITNVEMEASAIFVVARIRGVRAGMICSTSSNLYDGTSLYSGVKDALKEGWMLSIEAALETAVRLEL
ncbi:nucleoside phosphorylase [Agromyces sp. ISL-38]|uniref:nucleoside phosphorylase n=1 Tax=Agromyces sp. ISL-38 TaxID=2819107 RepID=UPI001BED2C66|nr:nucleoside phosphorylase [Agromyces sp. ISL-38]MBT2499446.1 nucleoside phosphorylase [Agromyces sp. ISL-38]MBT2518023.1 nucleoside phosphorylase [Streptomyces sp. ISL-90]